MRPLKRKRGKERGRKEGRVQPRENLEIGAVGLRRGWSSLIDATIVLLSYNSEFGSRSICKKPMKACLRAGMSKL